MFLSLLALAHAGDNKPSIESMYLETGGASQQFRVVVIVKDDTNNEVHDVELETSDGTFYGVTERISHVSGSFSTEKDVSDQSDSIKLSVEDAKGNAMATCGAKLSMDGSVAELECRTKYDLEVENLRVWPADEAGTEWDLSFDLRGDDVGDVGTTSATFNTVVNDTIEADPGPIEVESVFSVAFSGDPTGLSDEFDVVIYDTKGKQQDKASFDVKASTSGGVVRLNVVKAVKSITGLGLKEA